MPKKRYQALKAAGVRKTVMLTGDTQGSGRAGGRTAGHRSRCTASCCPPDKVEKVEELHRGRKHGKGESSPLWATASTMRRCCSRADIGIAMGAMGSDAAIEAADVVLMDDDPLKIAKADQDLPQVPVHRLSEHRLRHRRQADLPGAGRVGHRQHVAGDLRGCRRDDHRRAQRHPGAVCQKAVKKCDNAAAVRPKPKR